MRPPSGNFELAKAGIERFLDDAGPQDEFFLEHVTAGAEMRCAFTSDRSQVRAALDANPNGKTAVIDAMYLALHAMKKGRHVARALVVMSDALDNASIYNMKDLRRAFRESPFPIFLIIPVAPGIAQPLFAHGEEIEKEHDLMRLVNESGGRVIAVNTLNEMAAVALRTSSLVHSPYILYMQGQPLSTQDKLKVRIKPAASAHVLLYNEVYSVTPQ